MKEYINLLPEKNKEEIREEKKFRTIVAQEFSFVFPILILVAILFSIQVILDTQSQGLSAAYSNEQNQGSYQDLKTYEEKFQSINAKTALISKVLDNHLEWSVVLVKLSQLVPDDISITGIANKEYRLFLIGRARTREKLLEFQGVLNGSDCFSGVNMPLSNLVSKENIDFQIDFEIKKTCLKSQ
jgi:Tfp pilus assembly protein PilN